jgi:all-trans-retinol 13,14-reductase
MKEVFREFSFFTLENYWFKVGSTLLNISLDEFLRGRNAEPALIHFLGAYTEMLLGVSAKEVSLLTHLLGIGAYFYAAHTFEGGGGAIARALEDEARASGVRIITGSDVVAIVCDPSRRLKGLRLHSRREGRELFLDADACVSTIHPKRLLPLLPESFSGHDYARHVLGDDDTKAVGLFHLAVERGTAEAYSANVHQLARKDSGELKHRITLLPDFAGGAVSSASEKRISILIQAWDNDLLKTCPQRTNGRCIDSIDLTKTGTEASEPDYVRRLRNSMVARLEKTFPELKGKYRILGSLSPCRLDRLNATWNGSIYGLKCSLKRLASSTFRPLPDLYLAGQSVVAPGIFGTLVSAYHACNRVIRRIGP